MANTLILLRGPSGSGKSTIACALQQQSKTDVLIVAQDYYRHTLLNDKPDVRNIVPSMVHEDVQIALDAGYSVIVEGIFRKKKYLPIFQSLIQNFGGKSYIYYFDISFEETARRHATRDKNKLFSAAEMKKWYGMAAPLGFDDEYIIGQDLAENSIVRLIQNHTNV
jgi:predicted kinase